MEGKQQLSKQKYKACMLLAASGDAMGYRNGSWEFNTSSKIIHAEMMQLTNGKGPLKLVIDQSWRYSDDTVMHIATARGLLKASKEESIDTVTRNIARYYKQCVKYMGGRAPGKTCMKSISILDNEASNWNKIPYAEHKGAGCGASMRSACIGLLYHSDPKKLVGLAIESGRVTHHNPAGYLGSVVSAYFTALAIKGVDPRIWAAKLMEEAFPLSKTHIIEANRESDLNIKNANWKRFVSQWDKYIQVRGLSSNSSNPKGPSFPENYGVIEREHFYKTVAWNGWPGALGIDSVLIAYDAFLGCRGSWEEFCLRGILHGGDNDSTGTIGGAWFGAYYGFKGVPVNHYEQLQDTKLLDILGEKLYLSANK